MVLMPDRLVPNHNRKAMLTFPWAGVLAVDRLYPGIVSVLEKDSPFPRQDLLEMLA
jgi:hypothetical protein